MNSAHIVATAAFLLLLSQFNNAHAAGPYDGEWTGYLAEPVNSARLRDRQETFGMYKELR